MNKPHKEEKNHSGGSRARMALECLVAFDMHDGKVGMVWSRNEQESERKRHEVAVNAPACIGRGRTI